MYGLSKYSPISITTDFGSTVGAAYCCHGLCYHSAYVIILRQATQGTQKYALCDKINLKICFKPSVFLNFGKNKFAYHFINNTDLF